MVFSTWAWYCRYNILDSFLESVLEDWVLNDAFSGTLLADKSKQQKEKSISEEVPGEKPKVKITAHFLVKHGESSIYWLLLLREIQLLILL